MVERDLPGELGVEAAADRVDDLAELQGAGCCLGDPLQETHERGRVRDRSPPGLAVPRHGLDGHDTSRCREIPHVAREHFVGAVGQPPPTGTWLTVRDQRELGARPEQLLQPEPQGAGIGSATGPVDQPVLHRLAEHRAELVVAARRCVQHPRHGFALADEELLDQIIDGEAGAFALSLQSACLLGLPAHESSLVRSRRQCTPKTPSRCSS